MVEQILRLSKSLFGHVAFTSMITFLTSTSERQDLRFLSDFQVPVVLNLAQFFSLLTDNMRLNFVQFQSLELQFTDLKICLCQSRVTTANPLPQFFAMSFHQGTLPTPRAQWHLVSALKFHLASNFKRHF